MRRLQPPKRACAVHNVRKPAPDALVLLRRFIRHVRKDAEGGDVGKKPVRAERANVQRVESACHDLLCGADGIFGKTQRGGHVVDCAAGDVAQRRAFFIRQFHKAGDSLVECSVAAGADDQIVLRSACGDLPGDIPRAGRHVHGRLIAALAEDCQYLHERGTDLGVACVRIDEKQ